MLRTVLRTTFLRSEASHRVGSTVAAATRATAQTTEAMGSASIWAQQQVLRNVAVFPKTSSIKDQALITLNYDGSKETFARLHKETAHLLELRALGIKVSVAELLTTLERDFDEFYLATVDCIIVQRIGQHVLRINNSAGKTGRALFIELDEVRQVTMMILGKAKAKMFERVAAGIAFIAVGGGSLYATYSSAQLDKKHEELKLLLASMNKGGASGAHA